MKENLIILCEILGQKAHRKINIKRKFYFGQFLDVLNELLKLKLIKNLKINDLDINSVYRLYFENVPTIERKYTDFNIDFEVVNWKKLQKFIDQKFNNFNTVVTEPYGEEKQLNIVKKEIIYKARKLENDQFRISNNDFLYEGNEHIDFFKTIDRLRKEKFLKLCGGFFNIGFNAFECDIKLFKSISEIKEEYETLKMAAEGNKNKNLKQISPKLIENPPKIVWGNVEIPLPVGSKQFDVCKSLFQREKGKIVCWDEIAEEMDDLDIKWRTIYDAVRKVNKKVEEKTELKLFCVKGRTFYRKY
ncbi:MAG: hypothetical protein KBH94_04235 [Caldisericia bacterium]|nr:hypothetical protein [Caldisericia bacterium]